MKLLFAAKAEMTKRALSPEMPVWVSCWEAYMTLLPMRLISVLALFLICERMEVIYTLVASVPFWIANVWVAKKTFTPMEKINAIAKTVKGEF